jgi:hypothetical protein
MFRAPRVRARMDVIHWSVSLVRFTDPFFPNSMCRPCADHAFVTLKIFPFTCRREH